MGRMTAYLLVATLGFSAALVLASCGKEDAQLLPGETAREITVNLDSVKQLAEEGDCLGAESAAQQVSEQIEALTGVDAKLKEALEDGATRLSEVIDDCGEEETIEEVNPRPAPTEPEEVDDKKAEKEREKEEKQGEKEEREREKEEEREPPTTPSEPPAEEEKGDDGEEEGNDESPSGGVGPGSPVEEEG